MTGMTTTTMRSLSWIEGGKEIFSNDVGYSCLMILSVDWDR